MKTKVVLTLFLAIAVFAAISARGAQQSYIAGTITNSSGHPVASLWVILTDQGNRQAGRFLTGEDGRYYIGYLMPGTYRITVEKQNRILFQQMVNLPRDQQFNIRVP
jgi:hypothetical protein